MYVQVRARTRNAQHGVGVPNRSLKCNETTVASSYSTLCVSKVEYGSPLRQEQPCEGEHVDESNLCSAADPISERQAHLGYLC